MANLDLEKTLRDILGIKDPTPNRLRAQGMVREQFRDYFTEGILPPSPQIRLMLSELLRRFPSSQYNYSITGMKGGLNQVVKYSANNQSYLGTLDIVVTDKNTKENTVIQVDPGKNKTASYYATYGLSTEFSKTHGPIKDIYTMNFYPKQGREYFEKLEGPGRYNPNQLLTSGKIERKVVSDTFKATNLKDLAKEHLPSINKKPAGVTLSRPMIFLDSETGGRDEILSVSAVKCSLGSDGHLYLIDSYERFYHALDTNTQAYRRNLSIHGLTEEAITQNRNRLSQGNKSIVWDRDARLELKRFCGSDLLIGHNILQADAAWLFDDKTLDKDVRQAVLDHVSQNDYIDTYAIAANDPRLQYTKEGDKRSLKLGDLYRFFVHKSMASSGLGAHQSGSDVIANAIMFEKMYPSSKAAQFVVNNKGYFAGFRDTTFDNDIGVRRTDWYSFYSLIKGNYVRRKYNPNRDSDRIEIAEVQDWLEAYMDDTSQNKVNENKKDDLDRNEDFEKVSQNATRILGSVLQTTDSIRAMTQQMGGWVGTITKYNEVNVGKRRDRLVDMLSRVSSESASGIAQEFYGKGEASQSHISGVLAEAKAIREGREFASLTSYAQKNLWTNFTPKQIENAQLELYKQYSTSLSGTKYASVLNSLQKQVKAKKDLGVIDEAEELGLITTDQGDSLREKAGNEDFKTQFKKERQINRNQTRKEMAFQAGAINLEQFEKLDTSSVNFTQELAAAKEATKKYNRDMGTLDSALKTVTGVLNTLSGGTIYNPGRITAVQNQLVGEFGEGLQGFIPSFMPNSAGRQIGYGTKAIQTILETKQIQQNYTNSWINRGVAAGEQVAGGLASIGVATGNPALLGAGLGVGIAAGGVKLGTHIWGEHQEKKMQEFRLDKMNNLNTVGLMWNYILTPFQLAGSALKQFTKGLKLSFNVLLKFGQSGLNQMASLGTPLTNLTGVNYSQYQGLGVADTFFGFQSGTLNNEINQYQYARMGLNYLGQFDQNRLINAAVAGLYNETYGLGGTGEQGYARLVNKAVNISQRKTGTDQSAYVYNLSNISGSLPQIVQVLLDLNKYAYKGKSNWKFEDLQNPNDFDIYYRKINDNERMRYRIDSMQWQGMRGSFSNTQMRWGDALWNVGGQRLGNIINKFLDKAVSMVETGTGWWGKLRDKLKDSLDWLEKTLDFVLAGNKEGIQGQFSSLGDTLTAEIRKWIPKIKNGLTEAWPTISSGLNWVLGKVVDLIITWGPSLMKIWGDVITNILNITEPLVGYLSRLRIGIKVGANGLTFDIHENEVKDKTKPKMFNFVNPGFVRKNGLYIKDIKEGEEEWKLDETVLPALSTMYAQWLRMEGGRGRAWQIGKLTENSTVEDWRDYLQTGDTSSRNFQNFIRYLVGDTGKTFFNEPFQQSLDYLTGWKGDASAVNTLKNLVAGEKVTKDDIRRTIKSDAWERLVSTTSKEAYDKIIATYIRNQYEGSSEDKIQKEIEKAQKKSNYQWIALDVFKLKLKNLMPEMGTEAWNTWFEGLQDNEFTTLLHQVNDEIQEKIQQAAEEWSYTPPSLPSLPTSSKVENQLENELTTEAVTNNGDMVRFRNAINIDMTITDKTKLGVNTNTKASEANQILAQWQNAAVIHMMSEAAYGSATNI